MLAKYMTAGVIGSALLATAAFAQTATTDRAPVAAPVAAASDSQHQGQWRASKVVGLNVYNDSNESLGSINELLIDQSGKIQAVVIGIGGFLGIGEHNVAVAFDKIKFVNEPIVYAGAGGPNAMGSRPTSNTTTGAATTAPGAPATASKPNPWYPDHAVFSATKDQLKGMLDFKYPI